MSKSVTYQYDALGRLLGAYFDDCSSEEYAWDELGNRTTVTRTAPCPFKYNVLTKSANFDADADSPSYYRVTSSCTGTLPTSTADGSFMKLKAVGSAVCSLACSGSDHIFLANGTQVTTLPVDSTFGVLELIATTDGYMVT